MSKRRISILMIVVALGIISLGFFLLFYDDLMLQCLNREMRIIEQFNIATDRYNRKIQTKGKYAVVEKAIKEYLDENAVLLQSTLEIPQESQFKSILSYDNYLEDGPEFQKSISYLKDNKKTFHLNMTSVLEHLEEDSIKEYIRTKTKDTSLYSYYEELILSDTMKHHFEEIRTLTEKSREKMDSLFDISLQVLEFLQFNKDWVLEEGEIRFQKDSVYQQYLGYINQIQEKSK